MNREMLLLCFLLAACGHAVERPSSSSQAASKRHVADVTVYYTGPGPVAAASITLSGLMRENPIAAQPGKDDTFVFHGVSPGKYRLEAHHPKGIATYKELEVATEPVATAIGLRSAFLYFHDRNPSPSTPYRDAITKIFATWRGPERLAWVIDRPSSYFTEVMVGVAGNSTSGYVAFALHPSDRIADVIDRDEEEGQGARDDDHRHLPALEKVEVRASVRPLRREVALGVVCTWQEAVRQARPKSEVSPEVLDGNQYSFSVRGKDGDILVAETENLGERMLSKTPRTRAMSLFRDLHQFVDGHLGGAEFESGVGSAIEHSCAVVR
jgi:hypothetical protein